ncbi:MAG: hypothetical protein J6Y94_03475 [Bacteriovoracaceae bacterium]|nr:hypothetical protein [Bacteriovoracaceae bacterium]
MTRSIVFLGLLGLLAVSCAHNPHLNSLEQTYSSSYVAAPKYSDAKLAKLFNVSLDKVKLMNQVKITKQEPAGCQEKGSFFVTISTNDSRSSGSWLVLKPKDGGYYYISTINTTYAAIRYQAMQYEANVAVIDGISRSTTSEYFMGRALKCPSKAKN